MTKHILTLAVSVLAVSLAGPTALADTDSSTDGPPQDVFEANDNAWVCGDDGFLPEHCLNANSNGNTGNIMVFDGRGPQEGISFDPNADSRPCPHDQGSDDGTWWNPFEGAAFWVCHHNGNNNR